MPPSRDEASLDDDEFIVPEDPVEQERFKRRLMATVNSDRGKGVPSFDEMMDIALVAVDFDDPTTNVRGRAA